MPGSLLFVHLVIASILQKLFTLDRQLDDTFRVSEQIFMVSLMVFLFGFIFLVVTFRFCNFAKVPNGNLVVVPSPKQ